MKVTFCSLMLAVIGSRIVSASHFAANDRVRVRWIAPNAATPNRPVDSDEAPFGGREGTVIRVNRYEYRNANSNVWHPAYTVVVRMDATNNSPADEEHFQEDLLERINLPPPSPSFSELSPSLSDYQMSELGHETE